jgi:enamine deaminase RidA (YjgF/YER057c/UK114 family)
MKFYIAGALLSLAVVTQAQALTFKKGEVLGADGQIYQGASPDQIDRLIDKAKESGEAGGVTGNNVFVVVGDEVTFVPVSDLRGLPKDSQISVIGNAVVQDLTGSDDVTYEQISAVTELSEETGVSVEELLNDGDLASMDPKILEQVEAISAETGISMDNLIAVNSVLEAMPEDQVNQFIEDLGDLVDSGMAEQVDAFLDDLRNIEGAMDAITNFDSYESCVAGGGGSTCDAIEEAMNEHDI